MSTTVQSNVNALIANSHTEKDGSKVGGQRPATLLYKNGFTMFCIDGKTEPIPPGKWPAGECYSGTPEPTNTGNLIQEIIFSMSAASLAKVNNIEFDTIRTSKEKFQANQSFQLVPTADGWMVMISTVTGAWIDTGIRIPAITPDVLHTLRIFKVFNDVAHTSSTTAIEFDGTMYYVPAGLQGIADAAHSTWTPEVLNQVQLGSNANAGQIVIFFVINNNWS